jgi:uncharacterized protein YbjT (DUF2867 family)
MKALIIGASGLIGRSCLEEILKDSYYDKVEIFVRRTMGSTNPKLKERIINFDEIKNISEFQADHIYCCLGTTIKIARTKEAFRKVDYEYVIEAAKLGEKSGSTKFLVISSIGANNKTSNFYLHTKGDMEEDIKKTAIPSIIIFRPSLLTGERNEYRFGEKAGKIFMDLFGFFFIGKLKKYKSIKAADVAKAMIKSAKTDKTGKYIIESDEIQKIADDN